MAATAFGLPVDSHQQLPLLLLLPPIQLVVFSLGYRHQLASSDWQTRRGEEMRVCGRAGLSLLDIISTNGHGTKISCHHELITITSAIS